MKFKINKIYFFKEIKFQIRVKKNQIKLKFFLLRFRNSISDHLNKKNFSNYIIFLLKL